MTDDPQPAEPTPPVKPAQVQNYSLRERIALTYEHHGMGTIIFRILTLPLRFTPLRDRVRYGYRRPGLDRTARRWYRRHGRPVSIVIASYRDAEEVSNLVTSLRRTTRREMTQIIVADDASGPEHLGKLNRLEGVRVIFSEVNTGFAATVNRGIAAADPAHDVVVLNSDMIAHRGWLEGLQYATSFRERVGIVGARLLYGNGRIQFGGTIRNREAPQWFDHRFRFRPANFGPANVPQSVLAVTGACMYLTRELIDAVGVFDDGYPMAYEDVDLCLRAWSAGFAVKYWPGSALDHLESVTRGTVVGERERASQQRFWSRWGSFLDERNIRTEDGALRVVYVTEDTGVGGGHRDIFEHLNRLAARGHEVSLWTLAGPPDWFELSCPVRSFEDYDELAAALEPVEAIKVATWWNTAASVWRASVVHGVPVFFVQDIESSYYAGDPDLQAQVLAAYQPEFRYMTISSWNRERLRELGLDAELIPPGLDLENFRPLPEANRRDDMILALGRTNPLKNLPLTLEAWRRLPEPRPELCLFGIEPEIAERESGVRYVTAPTDAEVNELFNRATVFVQTSVHEGFCLPPLESMATGGAVVCTDAHGNRDFCIDGENCLMAEPDAASVAHAIGRLLTDPALRARLGAAGRLTAAEYTWERRIDALESFLQEVAAPHPITIDPESAPEKVIPPRS